VTVAEIEPALRPDTVLVSVMFVNNEIGVINELAPIGRLCRERGVLLHVDAAQAVGKVPVNVDELGADLLSVSAHKAYGPKGAGALYLRGSPKSRLEPLIHGGGHEWGMRSGTLATHQVVGMGRPFGSPWRSRPRRRGACGRCGSACGRASSGWAACT
jgi:cysteine desulfurase